MQIEAWQWIVAGLGAATVGVSKTGIAGLGILGIAVFALAFPPRDAVGIVLVVLIAADMVAVSTGGKDADWKHLRGLFPWAAGGVVVGALALGRINDAAMQRLIGVILLVLVALQFVRSRNQNRNAAQALAAPRDTASPADAPASADAPAIADISSSPFFAPVMGLLAGFTTMVANAAGPLMILYLLAMRLPKARFIGTAAWFFLVMNLFKVPFSVWRGMINTSSLPISLWLAPCAMVGAFAGRLVLNRIDQKSFETLALALTFCAAVKLLF